MRLGVSYPVPIAISLHQQYCAGSLVYNAERRGACFFFNVSDPWYLRHIFKPPRL